MTQVILLESDVPKTDVHRTAQDRECFSILRSPVVLLSGQFSRVRVGNRAKPISRRYSGGK
jgi:hypothetical protein